MPPDDLSAQFSEVDFVRERDLICDKRGVPLGSMSNIAAVLLKHPSWRGVIALDEFSGQIMKRSAPPFDNKELGEWTEFDDVRLEEWLSRNLAMTCGERAIMRAVLRAADANRYHDVRAYLNGLTWDQKPRLDFWLIEYCGAGEFYEAGDTDEERARKDMKNAYITAVARMWLLSAVARIFVPGCKADHVLILEGEQDAGKSTTFDILGGEWFTDAQLRIGDKDALQIIRGRWIVEMPELDSLNRSESSANKAFISQREDRYRAAYGHRVINVKRQCVFGGSVNHDTYLRDDTGNRRYWPVRVTDIDLQQLREERDQLWAEAVVRFQRGEAWAPSREQRHIFQTEQEQRYIGDAWEQVFREYVANNPAIETLTTAQVLADVLHMERRNWTRPEQMRVGSLLRRMGWRRKRDRLTGWLYVRPAAPPAAPTQPPEEPF